MPPRRRLYPDYVAFQQSISEEIKSTENRVRQLIGDAHWQTDGEHKETILRQLLSNHIPETLRVGKGFVCYPSEIGESESSNQIDILITDKRYPTLMKEGDLTFVTPDAVKAIIEVKTKIRDIDELYEILDKLANNIEQTRARMRNRPLRKPCWAGLFVFDYFEGNMRDVLATLQDITRENPLRAIDCLSFGEDDFIHYWKNGALEVNSPIDGPVWHSYHLTELASTYFINNVVIETSPAITRESETAHFPIPGTKELRRVSYVPLPGGPVQFFQEMKEPKPSRIHRKFSQTTKTRSR